MTTLSRDDRPALLHEAMRVAMSDQHSPPVVQRAQELVAYCTAHRVNSQRWMTLCEWAQATEDKTVFAVLEHIRLAHALPEFMTVIYKPRHQLRMEIQNAVDAYLDSNDLESHNTRDADSAAIAKLVCHFVYAESPAPPTDPVPNQRIIRGTQGALIQRVRDAVRSWEQDARLGFLDDELDQVANVVVKHLLRTSDIAGTDGQQG